MTTPSGGLWPSLRATARHLFNLPDPARKDQSPSTLLGVDSKDPSSTPRDNSPLALLASPGFRRFSSAYFSPPLVSTTPSVILNSPKFRRFSTVPTITPRFSAITDRPCENKDPLSTPCDDSPSALLASPGFRRFPTITW